MIIKLITNKISFNLVTLILMTIGLITYTVTEIEVMITTTTVLGVKVRCRQAIIHIGKEIRSITIIRIMTIKNLIITTITNKSLRV
jgi:hypothetical protein